MKITEHIINQLQPLSLKDSIAIAQRSFQENPVTHLPVVENEQLQGCFSEEDVQILEFSSEEIGSQAHLLHSFFADEKATVLELLKIFADNDANIIPVLNDGKEYIGYYDLRDVLDVFSTTPFMIEESETLIVEKKESDYSMTEINQIVEANGGSVLGSYVSEKHTEIIQVTLKIVANDITEIMHTFRRYDYKIISVHENDIYLEDLKSRSEYLQKYLEM
ncbi:CBS domain-containing protein [Polaribacter sp.]|nr:CBS domain-containing protein [Polaribacter sp.]